MKVLAKRVFLSYFVLIVEHFSVKLNNGRRTVKKAFRLKVFRGWCKVEKEKT